MHSWHSPPPIMGGTRYSPLIFQRPGGGIPPSFLRRWGGNMGGDCENYGGGLKSRCQKLWGEQILAPQAKILAIPPHFWRKMGRNGGGHPKIPPHPRWGGADFRIVPPHPANPWGGNLLLPPISRDRGGGIEKCSPPSVWGGMPAMVSLL